MTINIGLTYDLRSESIALGFTEEQSAEHDSEETIVAIETTLANLGFNTERIGNIYQLVKALSQGKRWDIVFNIAEGIHGNSREAQVPALLDAYQIPYVFSDALVLAVTLDKGMAKSIVRDQGIATPSFIVIQAINELKGNDLPYPLFAKPIAEGTSKGITAASKIVNPEELRQVTEALLNQYSQPVLIETYLPGREFTVGIVGTGEEAKVTAVMEIILRESAGEAVYSYGNKKNYIDQVEYRLADDEEAMLAGQTALAAYRALRCRDSGRVDLRSDENGIPNFMEVNPIAGLNPIVADLAIMAKLQGLNYEQFLGRIMKAVLTRLHWELPCTV